MEKETTQKENNSLTRQQKIENFLLNPDKEIFNSLQEFTDAIEYIKSLVGNLDLNDLEKIQGMDAKTPQLGVDYLTNEDLDKIDQFIIDKIDASWSSYPSQEEINSTIVDKVNTEVAKIPRVKGEPGTPGTPGVNGSPDTAEQILAKLRSLPKNQRINVSDIRGLQTELNNLVQSQEASYEDIIKIIESIRITIPAVDQIGIQDINGLVEGGTNITITGTGTLVDPFIINVSGVAVGDMEKSVYDPAGKNSQVEVISNKSTSVTTDATSDTKYPSVKAVKDYADGLVAGLLDYRGAYDASVNTFPASGGSGSAGAIMKGDVWVMSVAGTLGGKAIQIGDYIVANTDTPGQTSSKWDQLNTNIDYVAEDVANKKTIMTGNTASDIFYLTAKAIYDWATGLFVAKDVAATPGNLMQFDASGNAHDYGWSTSSFALPRPTTEKTTLVDTDEVTGNNSANTFSPIRTTWTNIKVFLKTYFDTLYPSGSGSSTGTNTGDNATNSQYSGLAALIPDNLTDFVGQTPHRVFYSNNLGDVIELALGSDGTFLKSNGASAAPSFSAPAGAGDVVGPASNTDGYVPQWDGANSKTLKNGVAVPAGGFAGLTALGGKQDSLGFTPENVANKSTSIPTDGTSDTKYPSVKAVKDYADGLVAGLLDYRGGYDASVNTFPAAGGSGSAGAVLKGDMWIVSVAGSLGGVAVQVGDSVIANVDTPGQTAGNWNILNSNISYVPEDVANKKITMTGNEASGTFYLTAKAIYDWAIGLFAPLRPTASKTTLVDADEVTGNDSAASFGQIKTTWTNVKAFLKTYFDTLYLGKTSIQSKSFIITNPTALSDLPLWRVPVGITIQAIHLLCKGDIVVGQLWQFDTNGLNGVVVDSADITGVVDTNINDDGTLSAPTITAGNYLGWVTTSVTGSPTYAIISFDYIIT